MDAFDYVPYAGSDWGSGSGSGVEDISMTGSYSDIAPLPDSGSSDSAASSGDPNWGQIIDSIGKNAVNVINASNKQPISTTYAAQQGLPEPTAPSGGADYHSVQAGDGTTTGGGVMAVLEDPKNMPWIVGAFAGVALLLALNSGGGRR